MVQINARDLVSQNATVTINWEEKAVVDVVEAIKAIVNGGGSISYLGNPQVNKTYFRFNFYYFLVFLLIFRGLIGEEI